MASDTTETTRSEATEPTEPSEPSEPSEPRTRPWQRWFRYTLPGACVALFFACFSFTPSLLPRDPLVQGAVTGVTAAIGYALGVGIAFVWREIRNRPPRPTRRRSWWIFAGVAAFLLVGSFGAGQRWQDELRDLMGVTAPTWWSHLLLPLVAALVFVVLVAIGRLVRKLYHGLAWLLAKVIGARAARVTGFAVIVIAAYLIGSGVVFNGALNLANTILSANDRTQVKGIEQPSSELRSGGPASKVDWDDLGKEGRKFVAGGPSADTISDFTGSPAEEPIRVFVGSDSADDAESRAELALADLQAMGGFDREYLLVATTTGSGSLNSSAVDSFEYVTGGDSAIVAMQYSHLPSWISYLVDKEQARDAGRELFDAVYGVYIGLPDDQRPKLVVFGESLGSFGAETAFSGEYDLANRVDGALLVGPPNFNTLFGEFASDRDAGSPLINPVYKDGRIVRFTNSPEQPVGPEGAPWNEGSRALYILHPSDPIVWWSPTLLWSEPEWLTEPPGADVLEDRAFVPLLTFWQITADLPVALGVPPGHGHDYKGQHAYGWAEVLDVEGWTDADTERLSELTGG